MFDVLLAINLICAHCPGVRVVLGSVEWERSDSGVAESGERDRTRRTCLYGISQGLRANLPISRAP